MQITKWFCKVAILIFFRGIIARGVSAQSLSERSPEKTHFQQTVNQLCDETTSCMSCGKLNVTMSFVSDIRYAEFDWELRNADTSDIRMTGSFQHNLVVTECVENDSYTFTVIGYPSQNVAYKLYVNDLLFDEERLEYFSGQGVIKQLIICSFDNDCDNGDDCTKDTCNGETKQCIHSPLFSSVCRSFGKPSFLAIQVVHQDEEPPLAENDLSDYIFGSFGKQITMRSQFRDCSFENFDPTPFSGSSSTGVNIENGVVKVSIPIDIVGEKVSIVVDQALSQSQQLLGNIEGQFDFVLLCLPFGTVIGTSDNWRAYALVNSYLSVYNGDNCKYLSVLMHEIGHNLGLGHSNDEANYGDETGYQGLAYSTTEGPRKCFNAAKYWDLGWTKDKQIVIDMQKDVLLGGGFHQNDLVGILEKDQSIYPVIIKLINTGDGYDYFLSFNRKVGANAETGEAGNESILLKQEMGLSYRDSTLLAKLDWSYERNTYYIRNPQGNLFKISVYSWEGAPQSVYIDDYTHTPSCITDSDCVALDDCTIQVCHQSICEVRPLSCDECGAQVQVNITTNEFPKDLVWKIGKFKEKQVALESGYLEFPNHYYSHSKCLPPGLYTLIVSYSNNGTQVENYADFSLQIGQIVVDNGTLSEETYLESLFIICSEDIHCLDFDGCSIDYCNQEMNICENIVDDENENCVDCSWMQLNITFDNFPEETVWDLSYIDRNFTTVLTSLISGEPYPFDFSVVFGRRKAPTKSGRRKAPTKYGRRKAGRRQAPARSLSQTLNLPSTSFSNARLLNDEDENSIAEAICLQNNLIYRFMITDTFGDGICCLEGDGSFNIQTQNNVFIRGGDFTDREEIFFAFIDCRENVDCNAMSILYTGECMPTLGLCLMLPKPCESYGLPILFKLKTGLTPFHARWEIALGDKIVLSYSSYKVRLSSHEHRFCLPEGSYSLHLTNSNLDGIDEYELRVGNSLRAKSSFLFKGSVLSYNFTNAFDVLRACADDLNNITVIYKCSFNPEHVKWLLYRQPSLEEIISEPYNIETYKTNAITRCVEPGNYVLNFESIYGSGLGYRLGAFVRLLVNDEIVDQFLGTDVFHTKNISFFLCESDDECDDDSPCTLDICDANTKLCRNEKLPCSECMSDFTPCDTTVDECLVSCAECGKVNAVIEVTTGDMVTDHMFWYLINNETEEVIGGGEVNSLLLQHIHKYVDQYCLGIGVYKFYVENSSPFALTAGRYEFRVQDTIYLMGKLNLKPDSDPKEVYFTVCNSNSQCDDGDSCTIDSCDLNQQLCTHEKLPCASCLPDYTPCNQNQTSCIPSSCADCGKSKLQFQLEVICTNGYKWSWSITNKEQNSVVFHDQFDGREVPAYYFDTVQCIDEGHYELTVTDDNQTGFSLCNHATDILDYGGFYKVYVDDKVIAEERQGFSFYIHKKEFEILGANNKTSSSQPTFTPSSMPTSEISAYFIEFEKSNNYPNESLLDGYLLQYKIAKGWTVEQFAATILDKSCVNLYSGKSVYVEDTQITEDVTRAVDKGIVSIQFNKTSTEQSDLWNTTSKSTGTLNFCVRTELRVQNTSVSFYDVKLEVRFNLLSSTFTQDSIGIKLQDSTTFKDESSSEVDACVCEQDHILELMECIEKPSYQQNSPIQICVRTIAGQKITKFNDLVFYQDNFPKFKAIENGVENGLTIATPGRVGTVRTLLVASLFKGDITHPVTVKGNVLLDFDDSRNLASSPNSVKEEERNVSFELEINLKKNIFPIFSRNGLALLSMLVLGVSALAIRESNRFFDVRRYVLINDVE